MSVPCPAGRRTAEIRPYWLWRLLGIAPAFIAQLDELGLLRVDAKGIQRTDYLSDVTWSERGFPAILTATCADGTALELRCLSRRTRRYVVKTFTSWQERLRALLSQLEGASSEVRSAAATARHLLRADRFTSHLEIDGWRSTYAGLSWLNDLPSVVVSDALRADVLDVQRANVGLATAVQTKNDIHVPQRATWLMANPAGGKPPTEEQALACVRDEDNTLVVAAAGSGKTSLIVEKVAYLVRSGSATPDQILVVAYNRKAASEVRERIEKAGISGVCVQTFHAYGKSVLASAQSVQPTLSVLAEQPGKRQAWLASLMKPGGPLHTHASEFLLRFRYPFEDDLAHRDLKGYVLARTRLPFRTLQGETVKSHGELVIADTLFEYGIPYEYEARYPVELRTRDRRQYKPDFMLQGGHFIEYWGIDEHGQTRGGVDRLQYDQRMRWAREIHREHGTDLLELFYYQHRDGLLRAALLEGLRERGFTLTRKSADELQAAIAQSHTTKFVELIDRFLALLKGSGLTFNTLRSPDVPAAERQRIESFLTLATAARDLYEEELRKRDEIDFDDMILRATQALEAGEDPREFKYILVDEFQDISTIRADLISATRRRVPFSRLFCVGDDWQSIYQFAGSRVGIMRHFSDRFGAGCDVLQLTRTHRFAQELADLSSKFISENPYQLKKTVSSSRVLGSKPVRVELVRSTSTTAWLARLTRVHRGKDVMLLGRYRKSEPTVLPEGVRFSTIHTAKGLECDIAVVDTRSIGGLAFPSTIVDDPVLGLLLPDDERFPSAEERRLFYVAMTRAREAVFVLTDDAPSPFADEILQSAYAAWVEAASMTGQDLCPRCDVGTLQSRKSQYGEFLGCSKYPYCDFTRKVETAHPASSNRRVASSSSRVRRPR